METTNNSNLAVVSSADPASPILEINFNRSSSSTPTTQIAPENE
jgi:hypothetical protein